MILSIPNEGRGAASMQLIATGLYPGAADLIVGHAFKPGSRGSQYEELFWIFIECKAEGGIQSDNQKAFEAHCKEMGIGYYIVRSLDEFKQVIENL